MRDNLRRYRAIREALRQGSPGALHGRGVQHLTTLAALLRGMVGGKSPQLPHSATKVPDGTKPESRVQRLTRWLNNAQILEEVSVVPEADVLLRHWALQTVGRVMDGSVVGRGCLALMLHVVSQGRALPLAWRGRHSPTGHGPEALHIEVVERSSRLIPEGSKVVFLGDGACDGTALQRTLHEMGWSSICRTAMSTTATGNGQPFRLDTLGACLQPGRLIACKAGPVTREAYGPIRVLCCGATGHAEPRYGVSHMEAAEEACRSYQKRFRIETLFSDQTRRGFHMQQSHISAVQRLSRLFRAAC